MQSSTQQGHAAEGPDLDVYSHGVTIKAWLQGDAITLQSLVRLLPEGDIRVVRDGDRYYLSSPQIDSPPAGERFYDAAYRLVDYVNGLSKVHEPMSRPVTLDGHFGDGDRQHVVVRVSAAAAYAWVPTPKITIGDAEASPPPSPGPQHARVALTNPRVQTVLSIIAQSDQLGWVDLYKVYELIKDEVPNQVLAMDGRITRTMIRRFTGSANHPGDQGQYLPEVRHAVGQGPGTQKRLSLPAARRFVRDWVMLWLDHLAKTPGS